MENTRLPNRQIWPDDIYQWLLSQPEYGENISALKRRRKQLAEDKRLSLVANKLGKVATNRSHITALLEIASGLPESFSYFKNKNSGFRAMDIQKLAKGARTFQTMLMHERGLVERYLEPYCDDENQAMRMGEESFRELIKKIESIALTAESGLDVIPTDAIPKLSRKKHLENAEKVYCVRQLSRTARKLFKKPLHAEVGLIITVCLNLPVVIDADEVRDLSRES